MHLVSQLSAVRPLLDRCVRNSYRQACGVVRCSPCQPFLLKGLKQHLVSGTPHDGCSCSLSDCWTPESLGNFSLWPTSQVLNPTSQPPPPAIWPCKRQHRLCCSAVKAETPHAARKVALQLREPPCWHCRIAITRAGIVLRRSASIAFLSGNCEITEFYHRERSD